MTGAERTTVENLLAQGLDYYINGNLRKALEAWQGVLLKDPENRRAGEYLKSALHEYGPLRAGRGANGRESTPPPTAWDDGPALGESITLEREETEPFLPNLELTPPPEGAQLTSDERKEMNTLLSGARELYALGDFSGALELIEKVLAFDQGHAEARRLKGDCEETLLQMYESQLGALDGVPSLAVKPDEIVWLSLDHRAGFVLAQIDGRVSYDDLYCICGMSRLDTARILAQLASQRIIVPV